VLGEAGPPVAAEAAGQRSEREGERGADAHVPPQYRRHCRRRRHRLLAWACRSMLRLEDCRFLCFSRHCLHRRGRLMPSAPRTTPRPNACAF